MIFLDAGPLIAFLNARDNLHTKSVDTFSRLYKAGKSFITTNRVVAEVFDAIRFDRRVADKKNAKPALLLFDALAQAEGFIQVYFITQELEQKAVAILRAYPDQNFSFCDACSFAVIEQLKLTEVYSYDKDFSIYKFRRRIKQI